MFRQTPDAVRATGKRCLRRKKRQQAKSLQNVPLVPPKCTLSLFWPYLSRLCTDFDKQSTAGTTSSPAFCWTTFCCYAVNGCATCKARPSAGSGFRAPSTGLNVLVPGPGRTFKDRRATPDRQPGVLNDRRRKPSSLRRAANDGRQRELARGLDRNNLASVAKSQYLNAWYPSLTYSLFFLAKELQVSERVRFRGVAP